MVEGADLMASPFPSTGRMVAVPQPRQHVLQKPAAPVVTIKPGEPGAGVGSCGHNDWDHVRSAVGKAHLRCRVCQARVAVPLRDMAYRDRCVHFRSAKGCSLGARCLHLHVRKDKQRLEERQAVHGNQVFEGVRCEQIPMSMTPMPTPMPTQPPTPRAEVTVTTLQGTSEASTPMMALQSPEYDGQPPPLQQELFAAGCSERSTRELAREMKSEDARRKAALCTQIPPDEVPDVRQFRAVCCPVVVPDEQLAGAWCPSGRYFHPEMPPPYTRCNCGQWNLGKDLDSSTEQLTDYSLSSSLATSLSSTLKRCSMSSVE